jgi:exodeoxyribonuclease VIII
MTQFEESRIIHDMPIDEYHDHPAISRSGLDSVSQSPRHYWQKYLNPNREKEDESKALAFGKAFHALVLEPHNFDAQAVIEPEDINKRTKAGKESYENFLSLAQNRSIITKDDHNTMKEMASAVLDHPGARILLEGKGQCEPSLFWIDEEIGVECRARFDWLREDGLIVDLKTSISAKPSEFERHAFNFRYHVQAAFYLEAYRRVFKKEPEGFAFIVPEKKAPFCVSTFYASPEFIEAGTLQYRKDLRTYAKCKKANNWHGYDDTLLPLSLPSWALHKLNNGEFDA